MGKEAEDRSTNIQMSPTSQKLIEGSNYQQACLKIIDITEENSSGSITSFSSSDLMEDAISSSTTSSASSSSNGPLFQFSDLMDQLPIKRGLSKYYQGKSQSFTSLTSVVSLEDLPKKENPYNYNKRIKSLCRSSCRGFDTRKLCSPKPAISKTNSRISSFPSLPKTSCSNNLIISSCRPPHSLPPLHKHF